MAESVSTWGLLFSGWLESDTRNSTINLTEGNLVAIKYIPKYQYPSRKKERNWELIFTLFHFSEGGPRSADPQGVAFIDLILVMMILANC